MKQQDLNQLIETFQRGLLSEKETVDKVCSFVTQNYPIYGLHKFDEDFRQDVILNLLERGSHLLHLFNPNYGDFFTFLYCFVSTIINTKVKSRIVHSMKEKLCLEESIDNFDEKAIKYHRIDFKHFEEPKVPYAPRKIPAEELQNSLKELSLKHQDKKILILALKSSYYLTDEQIERISHLYGIKPEYFYDMVQHCKDTLTDKHDRREKAQERRNFAYFHHKRYNRIIQKLKTEDYSEEQFSMAKEYESKEKKHLRNWNRLNKAFEEGHLYLRPTTKTVADLMGICERQVNYYINCAKKEFGENLLKKAEDGL